MQSIRKGKETNGAKQKWKKTHAALCSRTQEYAPRLHRDPNLTESLFCKSGIFYIYAIHTNLPIAASIFKRFELVLQVIQEKGNTVFFLFTLGSSHSCLEKFLLSPLGERQSLPSHLPALTGQKTHREEGKLRKNMTGKAFRRHCNISKPFQWKAT